MIQIQGQSITGTQIRAMQAGEKTGRIILRFGNINNTCLS